jgi:hypothetical protein
MGGACGAHGGGLGGERSAQGVGGKPEGKRPLGDSYVDDGRIILRWIFRKLDWVVGSG